MIADMIDRIYESAFVPELWPALLDDLAAVAGARGGVLFAARSKVFSWTGSPAMHDIFQSYVSDGWLARCTRKSCLLSSEVPGFLVEHDLWNQEELESNPTYRDFFRPHGLGWSAGTALPMPSRDTIVFSLERDYHRGPVEPSRVARLNELRPHLARPQRYVAARLQLQQAKSASDALALVGLPAMVVGEDGVVLEANALLDTVGDHVRGVAGECVALSDGAANKVLLEAIAQVDTEAADATRSFPVRKDGAPALVVHVIPIRRSAREILVRSKALVVVTALAAPQAPAAGLLKSLFDLTPSESRLARAIAQGETLDAFAASQGIALSTARTHLSAVLHKTGCARQAEIVALLAGVSLGRGEPAVARG